MSAQATLTAKPRSISKGQQILFATLWGIALFCCVLFYFLTHGWHADSGTLYAALPFLPGGLLGGWVSVALGSRFMGGKPATTRFAYMFAALATFSIGFTALVFAVQYQVYFSQWHAEFGSMTRLYQMFFTGLGSIFLTIATGLWPLLPWGVVLLFIASFGFSRGWFTTSR